KSPASFSVKNSFPARSRERSKGVSVALVQIPRRSGWPSGVRGAFQFFAAGCLEGDVCAAADPAATSPITSNPKRFMEETRRLMRSPLFARLFPERSVHQLFDKFDAFEFQKLSILFQPPVERHAHLPGSGECLRILDRDFVHERVRI